MMAGVGCVYEDAADRPVHDAWADWFAAALRQGDPGVYVNFLSDEGPERVREAYPAPPGTGWSRSSAATTPATCSTATRTSPGARLSG